MFLSNACRLYGYLLVSSSVLACILYFLFFSAISGQPWSKPVIIKERRIKINLFCPKSFPPTPNLSIFYTSSDQNMVNCFPYYFLLKKILLFNLFETRRLNPLFLDMFTKVGFILRRSQGSAGSLILHPPWLGSLFHCTRLGSPQPSSILRPSLESRKPCPCNFRPTLHCRNTHNNKENQNLGSQLGYILLSSVRYNQLNPCN